MQVFEGEPVALTADEIAGHTAVVVPFASLSAQIAPGELDTAETPPVSPHGFLSGRMALRV